MEYYSIQTNLSLQFSFDNPHYIGIMEGYNKSSVLKHPKIQLKEQKDETV